MGDRSSRRTTERAEERAWGSRREASFRKEAEAFAFELGAKLVEQEEGISLVVGDGKAELLPIDPGSRHPWFDVYRMLAERVPEDVYRRILADSARGRV